MAADGALHERGQLAAPQPRQGARRDDPQQPVARGARRRRGAVLPVARLAGRGGEVPLGPAPPRRHRHPAVARGRRAVPGRSTRPRRRPAAPPATTPPSCSTTRRGGAASSTPTPASTCATATGPRTSTGPCRPREWGSTWSTPSTDLSSYRLVVVPTLYLVDDATVAALAAAAEAGATVVITYFSGIVDEHDHIRLGGYPGAFRELLGVRATEFLPMLTGRSVQVEGLGADVVTADTWAEDLELAGAEAVATYVDGPAAGLPAVTRRAVGAGHRVVRRHAPRPRRHRPAGRAPGRRDRHRDASRRRRPGRGHPPGRRRRELALRHQPRRRARTGRRARGGAGHRPRRRR